MTMTMMIFCSELMKMKMKIQRRADHGVDDNCT